MDYSSLLTAEQKAALLEQRIQQFAAEAYQHDLNKQVAENLGDIDGIRQADEALKTLNAAITVYQTEQATIVSE